MKWNLGVLFFDDFHLEIFDVLSVPRVSMDAKLVKDNAQGPDIALLGAGFVLPKLWSQEVWCSNFLRDTLVLGAVFADRFDFTVVCDLSRCPQVPDFS